MLNREMLTLIPVFDAILSEGSLSRAADRLGVTQSAVSQALARLRKLANDELFENTGRGVRPTPRAQEMARHVYAALAQVNEAFTPRDIDLAKLERTFILDVGGGFDALVLPPLLPVVQREAPGCGSSSATPAAATSPRSSSTARPSWRSTSRPATPTASAAICSAGQTPSCWPGPTTPR